jgi:hypothetical protein
MDARNVAAVQSLERDRITLTRQCSIETVSVGAGRYWFFAQCYQASALTV